MHASAAEPLPTPVMINGKERSEYEPSNPRIARRTQ